METKFNFKNEIASSNLETLRSDHQALINSIDEHVQDLIEFKNSQRSDEELSAKLSDMIGTSLFFKID